LIHSNEAGRRIGRRSTQQYKVNKYAAKAIGGSTKGMDVYLGFGGASTIVADARDLLEALGSEGLILLHPCMREALTVLSKASAKDEKNKGVLLGSECLPHISFSISITNLKLTNISILVVARRRCRSDIV